MIHQKVGLVISFTSIMLAFCTNFFAVYMINERTGGTKRLQLNSKLHPLTFWAATFASDYLVLLLSMAGIYIAFVIGNMESYIDGVNFPYSLLLFLLYGFAVLPMTYLLSIFLSKAGIGMSVFLIFSLFGKGPLRFH